MSLAGIGTTAQDLLQQAQSLQAGFEELLRGCPEGPTHDGLVALKLSLTMFKKAAEKLTNLTGTARMVGDIPQEEPTPQPVTAPSSFVTLQTRSVEDLKRMFPQPFHGPDRRMLAAGDHSLDPENFDE